MNTYKITARPTNTNFDAAMRAIETLKGVSLLPMGQAYTMERGKAVLKFESSAPRAAIFAAMRGVECTILRTDNDNQIVEPRPVAQQIAVATAQAIRLGWAFSPLDAGA